MMASLTAWQLKPLKWAASAARRSPFLWIPSRNAVRELLVWAQGKGVVSRRDQSASVMTTTRRGRLRRCPTPYESQAFKEAVIILGPTLKPIGSAIAPFFRKRLTSGPTAWYSSVGSRRLALATSLVKPNVGKVVYAEELSGQRFTFYAPQVWMRQRRILCPAQRSAVRTSNGREFAEMQERIAAGQIDVLPPLADPSKTSPRSIRRCGKTGTGCNYVVTQRCRVGPQNQRRAFPRLGTA
ncbi:MAG: hypothetical protein CM15mP74_19250 [Halieaceae bacterium]|nr:MAG: hypothetical protein CM15mP74_19250 [Halieaceae bacterium]